MTDLCLAFQKNVHSDKFLAYMCDQVLPNLSEVATHEESENGEKKENGVGDDSKADTQLDILKFLAEMSSYCGNMDSMEQHLGHVFDRLCEYMPLPPADQPLEEEDKDAEPKLQFSHVECLMYAFHQMGQKAPEFLTDQANADRLKDFRLRLQYFSRGVQVYIRQLKAALQGKTGDALKTPEVGFLLWDAIQQDVMCFVLFSEQNQGGGTQDHFQYQCSDQRSVP